MHNASVPESSADAQFEQQQLILEAAGTGLWTWDIATNAVTWSPVCYSLVGADPDESPLSFSSFLQRVHEDDRGPLQAAVNASLHGDGTFEHTFRVIHSDGQVRWLVNHGRVLYSPEGRPVRMVGSVQDITRQRSAEQRYADTQERLSLALESSGLGIWTWNVPSGAVSWSDECYRIHGLEKDQFAGTVQAFADLIHPEDRDRVFAAVQAAISTHAPYISEFRIVKPDGAVAWVSNRGRASYASDGSPVTVVGTLGDITPLKKTATALHAALSASRTGTFHWNILTNAMTWDDELDRLFGLEPGTTVRSLDQFLSRVHPEDRAAVVAACERCRSEGADFDLEYRVILPDGQIRWLYDRGLTFRDATGRPASMTGACVDITARVASDRALALSRARLEYATRLSGVGFWYCDLPFDVLEWDDRVKEHFFFPPTARITIQDFYSRIHEEDRGLTREAIEASIRNGTPYDIVYRTVDPTTGTIKWIRALGGTDYASDGSPTHFDGVTVDVSKQKLDQVRLAALNQQLREQDQRKDQFIATLSHELRNPLSPIRAAANVIGSSHANAAQLQKARAIIERQVAQMSLLLDDLLDIARITQGKLQLKKKGVLLAEVLDMALESVRPSLSTKNHRLSWTLPPQPIWLDADPLRLSQILTNLLTNAGKYSEPGGHISIQATLDSGGVVISVKDEGIGIAPEAIPRIFEMFTQVDDQVGRSEGGLGIGLALVKGLTELHGGTVEARSGGRGLGSEFIVRLPRPANPSESSAISAHSDISIRTRNKILIADDNQDAATTHAMLLELAGHEVRVAYTGTAALAIADLFRPEVAVLDIGMPDLSGYEVAQQLRRMSWAKDIRLIAVTGWGQDGDRNRARESGFDHHLTKPVDPDELERLVRRMSVPATGTALDEPMMSPGGRTRAD